jgi:hypothetical protein
MCFYVVLYFMCGGSVRNSEDGRWCGRQISEWVAIACWEVKRKGHSRSCKYPEPFQMVFPDVIVFFLLSFFQALASHLDQRVHMSEEREKEKE